MTGGLSRAGLAAALVALAGCTPELPGDVVGAYSVRMRLEENNCGVGALPLPDGHAYAAELRAEDTRGFWRVPKAAPYEGVYREGQFEFSFSMVLELGNADAGTSGCTVLREEVLSGEVQRVSDAGSDDAGLGDAGLSVVARDASLGVAEMQPALEGTHRISFRANPAGRCANQQGPLGLFERLPCSALYDLQGSARKPF